MIKPAICYKKELEDALKKYFYSQDMMLYTASMDSQLIDIAEKCDYGNYQLAVLDNRNTLIGFISFIINFYSSSVTQFGAFSFKKGNPIMGKEIKRVIEILISKFHRLEFYCLKDNPSVRSYDRFLNKHCDIGRKITLKDVFKDMDGNYHDFYVYEFINNRK